jgi:hypothetical protein
LTTSDCELFFPGIKAYYGDDVPLDVHLKVLELGQINIAASNSLMSGVGTLEVQFWAIKADGTKELAIQVTLAQTKCGFTAEVNNMDVSFQITNVNSSNLTINSCTFGNLNPLKLKLELNNYIRY